MHIPKPDPKTVIKVIQDSIKLSTGKITMTDLTKIPQSAEGFRFAKYTRVRDYFARDGHWYMTVNGSPLIRVPSIHTRRRQAVVRTIIDALRKCYLSPFVSDKLVRILLAIPKPKRRRRQYSFCAKIPRECRTFPSKIDHAVQSTVIRWIWKNSETLSLSEDEKASVMKLWENEYSHWVAKATELLSLGNSPKTQQKGIQV